MMFIGIILIAIAIFIIGLLVTAFGGAGESSALVIIGFTAILASVILGVVGLILGGLQYIGIL